MSLAILVDQVTADEWAELASDFADYNIYQTWPYGACRAAEMKAKVERLVVRRGPDVLGMAQVWIKQIPLCRAGIGYIFRGPLWRRQGNAASDLQRVLEAIHAEYVVRRGLLVRVVPNLPGFLADESVYTAFEESGFRRDPIEGVYRTFMLDLSEPLDVLRRRFAQKWRNCLNQSERHGLSVRVDADHRGMSRFEELYFEMRSRKQFHTKVNIRSFRALQERLPPGQRQVVLLACQGGQPVAGHVASTLGETCIYLLGASNEAGRKCKAAYLLQWRAIEMAKAAGAHWYDLGGIDPEGNPGVYHFKAGLGGRDCTFVGQFEACGAWSSRYLVPLAERAYRRLQGLRGSWASGAGSRQAGR